MKIPDKPAGTARPNARPKPDTADGTTMGQRRPPRPAQVAAAARAAGNRAAAAFQRAGRQDGPASAAMSSATISPARAAAFTILTRVATTAAHSDDLLHAPAVNALSTEDRNLTTALVLGVLRWQIALDAQIRPLLQRPDAELHPAALLALRLGLLQLQHMDRIPPHAAINESVELARSNGAAHAAGMVNALLRRFLREQDAAGPVRQTLAAATPAETAHPAWLLQRWRAHYGGRSTRLLAAYDQAEPPSGSLFDEAEEPVGFTGYQLPAMDDGSRLVAELAAAAVEAPTRILDTCAAPGGKTRVLALRHPGAEIVAVDVSEKRLQAMRQRLEREPAAAPIATVVADMTASLVKATSLRNPAIASEMDAESHRHGIEQDAQIPESTAEANVSTLPVTETATPDETATNIQEITDGDSVAEEVAHPLDGTFDLILCDAPCSGTGTLARNPEIRHRLRESDLPRQAERQKSILRTALRKLSPQGRLLYSTCSMEVEENEAVVSSLVTDGLAVVTSLGEMLDRLPGLSEEVAAHLRETAVTADGALRTIPGVHAADGFYAVLLRKP